MNDSCKTKLRAISALPLQMLHMDLFGQTSVRSINHKTYCLVVTDDFSRFSWVFFLATKDETSGILKTFITGIENQINHKVKIIRCDNGTEFKNNDMNQFCGMKWIKREFSVANSTKNGVAKRKNRTLIEAASPQSLEDAVADDAGKKTNEEPANEGERNGQEKEGGASNKEDDQNVQDFRAELDNFLVQQKEGYANRTNRDSEYNKHSNETNKALLKDEEAEDMDVHLYRSMIGSLMYLTASRPDIISANWALVSKDSSFDLEAFSDSDYAGSSLNRKSTTEGCQFLGKRQAKKGRDTKIPWSSGPSEKVGDEVVHKELGDRMERAATTASSLEAEQDIVHSLGSDEGSMTLHELMVLYTTLSKKVESLESDLKQTKLTYGAAYTKLIMKVKKLENRIKSSKARRRVILIVSEDEGDLEDPSKQGRKIA
ncbi:putative ribonuclease H-like domain-containing protein [Tanacetum coccineum]